MICPICKSEMDAGQEDYAHECKECGCLVCYHCNHVMPRNIQNAESYETRTGYDFYCPECGDKCYSADLYGE